MDTVKQALTRLFIPIFAATSLALLPIFFGDSQAAVAVPSDGECDLIGAGTQANPYLIATANDYLEVPDCDATGVHFEQFKDVTFGFSGTLSTPVLPDLEGSLDGNGFRVSGLDINTSNMEAGFIGMLRPGSVVSNLTISSSRIVSSNPSARVGALFGSGSEATLFNVVVVNSEVYSSSAAGGIGGFIDRPVSISHLVLQESVVAGDGVVGGLFGEILVDFGLHSFDRWLVERSEIERTSPPSNSLNYLGGFIGEVVASNSSGPITVNLTELGFNGTLIGNNAFDLPSDDANPTLTGGVIGRMSRIDASFPVELNVNAFGSVVEVENETTDTNADAYAGVVFSAQDISVSVDYSYISAIAKASLPAGNDLELFPFVGPAGSPASLDVLRSFVDSDKSTLIQGTPVLKTTTELKNPATFSAFNIQSNLDGIYNNAIVSGGYFNPDTNGGFLSFVWAKDFYGPYVHFNTQIANGYLLPEIRLFGLAPDEEYFVSVRVEKLAGGILSNVDMEVSADDHAGLAPTILYFDGSGYNPVPSPFDGNKYELLFFYGNKEQLEATLWRIYVEPTDLVGATAIGMDAAVGYQVPTPLQQSTRLLTVLECSLPSQADPSVPASGTAADPYMVDAVADFPMIGQCMAPGKHFELANDIDFGGIRHFPIGHDARKFSGVFDGAGYEITGLVINEPHREDQGFFGEFGDTATPPQATIKNLSIDGDVVGRLRSAVLAGDTDNGNFQNVTVTGSVSAELTAGLLTGDAEYLIVDGAVLDGDVTVMDEEAGLLAGEVTSTYIEVQNVTATGRVIAEDANVGGLIGVVDSDVAGSKIWNVDISVDVQIRLLSEFVNNNDVGGLVGESYDMEYEDITIRPLQRPGEPDGRVAALARSGYNEDSDNFGGAIGGSHQDILRNVVSYLDVIVEQANSGDEETGGLIGEIEGSEVYGSAAHGDVLGYYEVGGLIGEMDNPDGIKIVDDSHAFGDVTGYQRVGGLVGFAETANAAPAEYLEITNSSASGTVTGLPGSSGQVRVGGLLGGLFTQNDGMVFSNNSYLGTAVNAPDFNQVGGLIGEVLLDGGNTVISGNTVGGSIEGDSKVGGLIGYLLMDVDAEVTIDNSLTDTRTEGLTSVGGLIGEVLLDAASTIADITGSSVSGNVIGAANVGGLLGYVEVDGADLTISGTSNAEISAPNGTDVGGFVGEFFVLDGAQVLIQDSAANGAVLGNRWVGGFVGYSDTTGTGTSLNIRNSSAAGDVTGTLSYVGGFIGRYDLRNGAQSQLYSITATGNVDGTGSTIGGLIGQVELSNPNTELVIDRAHASGDVSGANRVGGFVGYVDSSSTASFVVSESAAEGDVIATDANSGAGGFIGLGWGAISDSYSSGAVTGQDQVGGFIGVVDIGATPSDFTRVYSSGTVTGNGNFVGGFAGEIGNVGYTTDAYYRLAAIDSGLAHESAVVSQATGLSDDQILEVSSFENWDIENGYDNTLTSVWVSCPAFERNGPALRWMVDLAGILDCTLPQNAVAPYDGPIIESINDPEDRTQVTQVAPKQQVLIVGRNLSGVTQVAIAGAVFEIESVSDSQILVSIPADVIDGIYDLIVTSDTGVLTVPRGIRLVSGGVAADSLFAAWTSLKGDYVKVYAKNPVGAGKVQFFVNGKEVAWVRAINEQDPKLRKAGGFSYLVRSVDLLPGKNVFEIHLNGERIRRVAYTLRD